MRWCRRCGCCQRRQHHTGLCAGELSGHLEVVKVLLSRSTPDDVNTLTNYGTDAVHVATRAGDKQMMGAPRVWCKACPFPLPPYPAPYMRAFPSRTDLLSAFLKSYTILQQAREAAERKRLEGGSHERNARAKKQEEHSAKLAGLPPVSARQQQRHHHHHLQAHRIVATACTVSHG